MTHNLIAFWRNVSEAGANDPASDDFAEIALILAEDVRDILGYIREREHLHQPFRARFSRLYRRAADAIHHPRRILQQRRDDRTEEIETLSGLAAEVEDLNAFLIDYEPTAPRGVLVGHEVRNGQAGVYYIFADGEKAPFGPPVYFHKKDDQQIKFNKGVGQMGIAIDLVVAHFTDESNLIDLTRTLPRLMLPDGIDVSEVPFRIIAVKAMTGVQTPLARQLFIVDDPSPN
jgi:hypothetical protein